ncbi:protein NRT1/ PTR FAMILY 7.1-like [Tripterygium wilfordii]|uniref:Protein NRT1/ PTR FAMILY 7.1-like n=1 Tax=Tripterygium wilfordii TaxID=458696 RepID=A0A7J7DR87_TRIWF|nr:protein NRT1/ PTR FAMILY 7.1-like [Tripterygium wilfordii]
MTKGFHGFSSSPASPVISRPDFNVVIDTSPFLSPESVTIPRDVTLSVTKFRKRSNNPGPGLETVYVMSKPLYFPILAKITMEKLVVNVTQVRDENYRLEEAVISNKIINKDEQKLAIQKRTGGWKYASILLVNQGLATLAFFGVGVNLVLFLTRVLGQDNASAANNVSKWTGTVYMCSLIGAFLSDSYWGRYLTCTIFQLIFVLGLSLLSISSGLFLVKPAGCGDGKITCMPTSSVGTAIFYLAIYLIAFGYGGHQPTIATFGSDQFDEANPKEKSSKAAFFCYFYFSLNAGSLFSNTILAYYEDSGRWTLGFLVSLGSAVLALVLFWSGTRRYRYVQAYGNPLPRIAQVFVAVARKWDVIVPANSDELYEVEGPESAIKGSRKIIHCNEFA